MKVLAIDPGERVGYATATIEPPADPQALSNEMVLKLETHGISAMKDFALAMFKSIVLERKYDAVVFETFRINPKKAKTFIGNDMPTIQLIGMIRLCCWVVTLLHPDQPVQLVSQGPSAKTSARMSLIHEPDGVIRQKVAAAEALKHDDGHDGDALLHLWNYYFERYF